MSTYSTSRVGRWPIVLFYTFLNTAGISYQILFTYIKQKEVPKHTQIFLKILALWVINEHLAWRSKIPNFLWIWHYFPKRKFPENEPGMGPPTKAQRTILSLWKEEEYQYSIFFHFLQHFGRYFTNFSASVSFKTIKRWRVADKHFEVEISPQKKI